MTDFFDHNRYEEISSPEKSAESSLDLFDNEDQETIAALTGLSNDHINDHASEHLSEPSNDQASASEGASVSARGAAIPSFASSSSTSNDKASASEGASVSVLGAAIPSFASSTSSSSSSTQSSSSVKPGKSRLGKLPMMPKSATNKMAAKMKEYTRTPPSHPRPDPSCESYKRQSVRKSKAHNFNLIEKDHDDVLSRFCCFCLSLFLKTRPLSLISDLTHGCRGLRKFFVQESEDYRCVFCSARYKQLLPMSNHLLATHGVEKFLCRHCDKEMGFNQVKSHCIQSLQEELVKEVQCLRCIHKGIPSEFLCHLVNVHKYSRQKITRTVVQRHLSSDSSSLTLVAILYSKRFIN